MSNPYIVVATMLHDQARYLPEWIEFTLLQGVDRIVIYHDSRKSPSQAGLRDRQVAEPYIQMGVLEWISWPADWMEVEKEPFGPRIWKEGNETESEAIFKDAILNDCVNPNPDRTAHLQAGCQKAAFIDVAARYRNRARWVGAWDVDEFVFGTDSPRTGVKFLDDWENHTLAKKLADAEDWDEVWVDGDIFGTNGHFTDPVGSSGAVLSQFPMVTELYKYRYAPEWRQDVSARPDIATYSWSRKALTDPRRVMTNHIHGWSKPGPDHKLLQTRFSNIRMFHYQYRSTTGCHDKAVANGNPTMEYNPVREAYFDEKEDGSLGKIAPKVREMIGRRLDMGWWKEWVPEQVDGPLVNVEEPTTSPPDICLAFTHLDPNVARLRRSISSVFHHLRTHEPSLTFETVLVTRTPLEGTDSIFDEFPIDDIKVMDPSQDDATAYETLMNMCSAPVVVSLAEGWETRTTYVEVKASDKDKTEDDSTTRLRRAITSTIVTRAISLLEHRADLLEVWIGDVPDVSAYNASRTEWIQSPGNPDDATDWYRVQGAGDDLAVFRWGGVVRDRQRWETIVNEESQTMETASGRRKREEESEEVSDENHETNDSAEKNLADLEVAHAAESSTEESAPQSIAAQETLASRAARLGLYSAHFCLGKSQPSGPMDLCAGDDGIDSDGTMGIMWRMRFVLEDGKVSGGLVDRG
ncbi:hypothetical protein HKX48_004051 [Thoreauomyces humboldtii]|nr:hypothetical protein HKX48_004051 [Thoreauomyces humboldtii]